MDKKFYIHYHKSFPPKNTTKNMLSLSIPTPCRNSSIISRHRNTSILPRKISCASSGGGGRDLSLRLPLPLPAPEISMQMQEKILSLELMGLNAGRILCMNPDVREASAESIQQIVHYLISKGIRYKDLAKIFGHNPKLLTSDINRDLAPVFEFLYNDLEVPEKNFYKVLVKCPKILATNVRDQLRPALFYLQRLGIKDKITLAYRQPVLLVLNIEETLNAKLEYIKDLGFSHGEACKMVIRSPYLLTFSIENNFKPKLKYFLEEMKGELKEIKEFPQYFAFSLEQRIKPRHKELVDRGLKMDLPLMLKSMDLEFEKMVRDLESRKRAEVKKGSLVN